MILSFNSYFNKMFTTSLFIFNPARLHIFDRTMLNYGQLNFNAMIDVSTNVIVLITLWVSC